MASIRRAQEANAFSSKYTIYELRIEANALLLSLKDLNKRIAPSILDLPALFDCAFLTDGLGRLTPLHRVTI